MRFRSALLCACLAAYFTTLHAAPRIALSAFVREDEYSNPRLSPDGKLIAITVRVPSGERFVPVVMVYTLPDLKMAGALRMPVFEVPLDYTWVSKTRLAIAKGRELGSREKPVATGEVVATEFDGSKQEYLYGRDMFKSSRKGDRYDDDHAWGYIEDVPRELNNHFFLTSHAWRGSHSMLYDINAVTASRRLLADLPVPDLGFVMQQNGTPRFSYGNGENANAVLFRYNDATAAWEQSASKTDRRYLPQVFSADDKDFLAIQSSDGGPDIAIRENLATGARTTLFQDPRGSVTGFMYGPGRDLPFAAMSAVGIPSARYFDPDNDNAKLHKLLSSEFPGSFVSFLSFTDDGNTLLFAVMSDRDPGSYYLFNKTTGKADLLFSAMSKIEPEDMTERRPIAFKARDGIDLFGFMTVPKHAPGARLPLVLVPHGGPHGPYDRWFFDVDAQFLASRGYAVLQVNFRGSGGRGLKFTHAGYRQWGGKIQDDLVDGVKWAIAQGEVDGARVCAYGASFGAYSALMLAAREPAMFKCAVGYAGVYDLNLMYKGENAQRDAMKFSFFDKYIGQDKAELDRNSPVTLANQITSPVLLVHGEKDKRALFAHAEEMRAALISVNRPPEWLVAPNEGHGFYDTKNVTMFYEKLEAFLEKHIGK